MKTICSPGHHYNGFHYVRLHTVYAHLAFARFEHSVCRGSLMTNNIILFA